MRHNSGAMPFLLSRLYRRLGQRYFYLFLAFEIGTAVLVTLGTVGLFTLYEEVSAAEFWKLVLFAEAFVALALVYAIVKGKRLARPVRQWLAGGPDRGSAQDAWRHAVALPREFVSRSGWKPFAIALIPVSIFFTVQLDLPAYSAIVIFGAACVSVAYAAMLHFFASEVLLRPIVEDISRSLPEDFAAPPVGVPLRLKLLGALPIINVITGVVVSGLSADARASFADLGVDVVVAVLVAFTLAFELTVLVTRSVLSPVGDLLEATERVKHGDLGTRVPVVSGDELGVLAGSFNEMMRGLSERERLQSAFGSYVDPAVAERVIEEGELLEGQDLEVTILIVDIRDFTPFAERSSASETVNLLNRFFELVVPIVLRNGGHANKLLGDGVLAVFGAPERRPDHPDRAVRAARELAQAVEREFAGEVEIGVGINSGPVAVGSIGGGGRLEFGVIGDPVNVAARVEAATRETGDVVLLTESTRALLTSTNEALEPRGTVPLKGKSEPVPIYTLATVDASTAPEPVGRAGQRTGQATRSAV